MGAGRWISRGVAVVVAAVLAGAVAATAEASRVSLNDDSELSVIRIKDRSSTRNDIVIQLVERGRAVTVRDRAGLRAGDGCVLRSSGIRALCELDGPESEDLGFKPVVSVARVGPGDDRLRIRGRTRYRRALLFAFTDMGGGADRVVGGEGPESVIPGPGADRVDLGLGSDQVVAESGLDGDDRIEGESFDALNYGRRRIPMSIDLRAGTAVTPGEEDVFSDIRAVVGGKGADVIMGGAARNAAFGGGDRDLLIMRGGNDDLIGGAGVDEFRAGPGDDFVFATDDRAEDVDCGPGRDYADVDAGDVPTSCERKGGGTIVLPASTRFGKRVDRLLAGRRADLLREHVRGAR